MVRKTLFFAFLALVVVSPSFSASSSNTEKPSIYTVHRGDSLWKISERTWGDGTKWPLLYKANQEGVHDPDLIFPGQNLVIPEGVGRIQRDPNEGTSTKVSSVSSAPAKEVRSEGGSPNVPASEEEQPETSSSGTGKLVLWLLGLLILAVGLYLWFSSRKKTGNAFEIQQPEPHPAYRPAPPSPPAPAPRPMTPPPSAPASSAPVQSSLPLSSPPTPSPMPAPTPSALPIAASAADTYIQQGLFEEAAKVYRGILERDPNNTEVAGKLMRLEERMRLGAVPGSFSQEPPEISSPSVDPGTTASLTSPEPTSMTPVPPPEANPLVKEEPQPPPGNGQDPK